MSATVQPLAIASGALIRAASLSWLALRQALWRIPMLLVITLVTFLILRGVPIDPVNMLMPPNASAQEIAELSHQLGLDRPVLVQYLMWLRGALSGDFGISIQTGQPVLPMVLQALPMTLQILFFGLLSGLAMGLGSGMLAFRARGSVLEPAIMSINGVMMAIPDYLWAIALIVTLGVGLQWLPFIGPIDPGLQVPNITGFLLLDCLLQGDLVAFGSALAHLFLPSLTLGLCIATPIARVLHSSLIEVYQEDYLQAARLRGLDENTLLVRHALRNAALPTISLIGVQASVVIGGTLLIETIFGLPGIGALMIRALGSFDLQTIQLLALTYAITVQLVNMLSDFTLRTLNPRLRIAP
ncbi:ABC transporter permease [Pseudomonas lopnurensis]|uniref:ABC transporter permease n=1 Tax=Pseudomonas lopnurensis TaxID=1477517 RepID=UPI00187A5652|nr:ABC transporter permease [Pseudomonas lopnurensis]MBE7375706.1 ABC transporter permease [Pseudomonas lopnurensis]